mmetsp:Transcript_117084/g.239514  ORF Transcript_117084/g.239514 Transcript_117084/m.239514 type:complete len:80 (-) Transcript_117084:30-269(-)
MVRREEGLLLQSLWQGVPSSCDKFLALRLQCRLRALDDGLECGKEELLLPEPAQGLLPLRQQTGARPEENPLLEQFSWR